MGGDSSKLQRIPVKQHATTFKDPCILITCRKDGAEFTILRITKCMHRGEGGLISVFSIFDAENGKQSELIEFDKGVDDGDVWDYVKAYVSKTFRVYDKVYVSCNYRNDGGEGTEFTEKTLDNMQDHVRELVRLMIKTASLFITHCNQSVQCSS